MIEKLASTKWGAPLKNGNAKPNYSPEPDRCQEARSTFPSTTCAHSEARQLSREGDLGELAGAVLNTAESCSVRGGLNHRKASKSRKGGIDARIDAALPAVDLLAHRACRAPSRWNRSGLEPWRPDTPSNHLCRGRAAQPAAGARSGKARRRPRGSRGDTRLERFPSPRTLLRRLRQGRGLSHGESTPVEGGHRVHHDRREGFRSLRGSFLCGTAHRDRAGGEFLCSRCRAPDRRARHERCRTCAGHTPLLL